LARHPVETTLAMLGGEHPSITGNSTNQIQDADDVACHCEKIMAVGHLIDNNQANGMTGEQLYDQLFQPVTWPSAWDYNAMKDLCCKLWNMEPTTPPGPCTPTADYEPGNPYSPPAKQHIDNEINDPNHDPNLDLFGDEPCSPEPPVTTTKRFLDTCGCKEIKKIEEDYITYVNANPPPHISIEAYALQQKGFAIDSIQILLDACAKEG